MPSPLSLLALLSVACAVLGAPQPPTPPTPLRQVDLGYAKYQSDLSLEAGVTSFLGIRYAAPPTGQNRFRRPQPPAVVAGFQNATQQPTQCFQQFLEGAMGASSVNPSSSLVNLVSASIQSSDATDDATTDDATTDDATTDDTTMDDTTTDDATTDDDATSDDSTDIASRDDPGVSSEDCLFLNVHVPTKPAVKGLLPVIVYIHGGGYDAGNVSIYPVFDFVAGSNSNLVSVSIQYRLGLFGFLSGQKVKDGGDLNVGLLDQNFALQWVQSHISAFGGDPTKVTIWGQSAGAGSVLQHVVAHAGNTQPPLFRAAMMNSPFLPFQYAFNDPIPESLYTTVLQQVGCAKAKDTLACLRTVPAPTLLAADSVIGLSSFFGTYAFVPVVDGSFITERPMVTLLTRKRVNGQALLVSSNGNEGALFTPASQLVADRFTLNTYVTKLFPRLSKQQVQQAVQLYSQSGGSVTDQATAIMGDSIFVCPAYAAVSAFGSHGFKAMFALPPAFHADDLSYDFSNFPLPPSFVNAKFSKSWQQSFLNTALSLTPNTHFDSADITPQWPAYSSNRQEMMFNKSTSNAPVIQTFTTPSQTVTRCNFWASLSQVIGQ